MSLNSKKLYITVGIATTFLLTAVLNATQGYMLPQYVAYYPQLAANQGLMSAMQSVGSIAASVLTVLYFRKDAAKRSIYKVSLLLMVVFCLTMFLKPQLGFAMAAYVLFGGALAWQSSTTSSITADIHSSDRVAPFMGLLHGAFGIGGLAAPMLFLLLENAHLSWNQIFLVLFAVIVVASLAVWRIFKHYDQLQVKHSPVASASNGLDMQGIKRFLLRRSNILLLVCAFLYAGHQISISLWVKQYMMLQYSDRFLAALALSLFWIGTAAARIGQIVIRVPLERQLVAGNILAAVFCAAGLAMHSPVIMVCAIFCAGLAAGGSIPILLSLSTKINPGNSFLATSVALFVIYFAQFTLPIVAGALVSVFTFRVSMYLAVVTAAICGVSAIWLKKARLREHED